ncbi:MAG: hypothetical protein ABIN36_08705 [Ferruginibacter sp.]
MVIKKYTYRLQLVIIFCTVHFCTAAQNVEIKTDKNQILIGERIEYDLFITLPSQGYSINFGMPDSLPHFETIENGDYDTMRTNGSFVLRRKFLFTSFDSGAWYIPAMPVILSINDDRKTFTTDSVLINVGYSAIDSSIEIRDIKPIMEIKATNSFAYFIVGGLLLLLVLIFLINLYFKRKGSKPLPVLHSALSPYDEAMKDLKDLAKLKPDIATDVKHYHSQLSFIFKRYYSRITSNNLLNKTTGDLLLLMKQQELASQQVVTVAQILRIGDAVKFAKHMPAVLETENCLAELKQVIEGLEKDKPFNIQQ